MRRKLITVHKCSSQVSKAGKLRKRTPVTQCGGPAASRSTAARGGRSASLSFVTFTSGRNMCISWISMFYNSLRITMSDAVKMIVLLWTYQMRYRYQCYFNMFLKEWMTIHFHFDRLPVTKGNVTHLCIYKNKTSLLKFLW